MVSLHGMKYARLRTSIYFKCESVSFTFSEIFPRGFSQDKKEKPCITHDLPFLDFPWGVLTAGLHHKAKRFRANHVLSLVAGQPDDPEEVGGDDEHVVQAGRLDARVGLDLVRDL